MLSIILAEFSRFKKLAGAMAVLQFIFVLFVVSVQWFMEAFVGIYHVVFVANVVFATGLGWFQMRSLSKTNRWAFMIHRPVPRIKLFGGFALGALLVFGLATLLPLLLAFVVVDLGNQGVVDGRLYLILPVILGVQMCGYFAAAFSVLYRNKLAPLIFVVPALLVTTKAHGLWVFFTLLVVLIWLAYVCYSVFKPALDAPVKKPLAGVMIALPIQYLLSIILAYAFNWVFQMGLILTDPDHNGSWSTYWKPDSFHYAEQMTDRELLEYGLKHSQINSQEIGITNTSFIGFNAFAVDWFGPITRNQLLYMDRAFDNVGKIRQESEGINWYFNHGQMLFFGIHERNAQFKGWMDNSGRVHETKHLVTEAQRFADIPRSMDKTTIYVGEDVFVYGQTPGEVSNSLVKAFSLDAGETFISSIKPLQKDFGVLSNDHLYLLKVDNKGQYTTFAKVPLNSEISNLSRVTSALVNGQYYVSVLTGNEQRYNYQGSNHAFYQVDANSGQMKLLHNQPLTQNWPDVYRYRQLIVSPALKYLHDVLWSAIKPYHNQQLTVKQILTQPIPTNVLWIMLLISISIMAITSWIVRPLSWPAWKKFSWIIVNGLTGLPGLISLFFLNHLHKPPE